MENTKTTFKTLFKKTTDTFKEHPIIFTWFLIPFAYQLIRIMLISTGVLSPMIVSEWYLNVLYGLPMPGVKEYITWGIGFFYNIAWSFIMYPALIYFIYLAAENKLNDNWFKQGVKHGWWRIFVFTLVMALGSFAAAIPIGIIYGIIIVAAMAAGAAEAAIVLYIVMLLPLFTVIMVITGAGISSVIGEKNFGSGLGLAFKTGFKHFFRILLISLPQLILFAVTYYLGYNNPGIINSPAMLVFSLIGCVIAPIIAIFCMHCYIDVRDRQAEKKALEIEAKAIEAAEE